MGTITSYHIGKCHKESPFNNSGECEECEWFYNKTYII
jgi:hypothetical protein